MGRLVGLDGQEIVNCTDHEWHWTGVTVPCETPMGVIPVSILYCARCLTQRPLAVKMPNVSENAAPPPGIAQP